MRQAGVSPDRNAANAAVTRWLREVANARVHATTNDVAAERLLIERRALQALPAPYGGRSVRGLMAQAPRKTLVGSQHPLSVNDDVCADAKWHPNRWLKSFTEVLSHL